jgi:hypothetical protein
MSSREAGEEGGEGCTVSGAGRKGMVLWARRRS